MQPIIVVDDEEDLLGAMAVLLARELPDMEIRHTQDPRQAMAWLEEQKPRVLISDVRMPAVTGLELLSFAFERWGTFPVILTTAFASPEVNDLIRLGTFKHLLKPFRNGQLMKLVRESLEAEASDESALSMPADVIQLHALAGSTGGLYIASGDHTGSLWFSDGQIVHAVTPGSAGEDAFHEVMRWKGGRFSFVNGLVTVRSIEVPSSELLLEAYRRRDEVERGSDDVIQVEYLEMDEEKQPSNVNHRLFADEESAMPNNVKECLARLENVDGYMGGCVADSESGMSLGSVGGGGINLDIAAASNAEVVKAKRRAMKNLNLRDEIEDILISLGRQYHLIRPVKTRPSVFFYVVLDRTRANLALARMALSEVEKDLVI